MPVRAPVRRRGFPAVAMIVLPLVAAASAARAEVTPLDLNATEPLHQQVARVTTRPSSGGAPANVEGDPRLAAPVTLADVDQKLAAVDREIERLRALGDRGAARAEALSRRAADVRALRDANGVLPNEAQQPELHLVGLYQGRASPDAAAANAKIPAAQRRRQWKGTRDTVVVEVQPTGRPLVLAICAYSRITWDVRIAKDANVRKVIVGGYEPQVVTGVPETIPVETHTHEGEPRSTSFFYTYGPGTDGHAQAVAKLRTLTSLEVATFTGMYGYKGEPLVVGPGNPQWVARRVMAQLEPLHREATAYALAERRAAVADVRFTAVKMPTPEVLQAALPPGAAVPAGAAVQARVVVRANPAAAMAASLAEFTPRGPIDGTEIKLPQRTSHAVLDPQDSTVYAIDPQGVFRVDPKTHQVTRLTLNDPGLPRLSSPTAIAFDTKRRRVIVATRNNSGFLYAYDPAAEKWSGLVELENVSLWALAYVAAHDRLYGVPMYTGARSGRVMLIRYTPEGDADQVIDVTDPALGLTMRMSSDGGPQLVAVGEQLALLTAPSRMDLMRIRAGVPDGPPIPRPKCYLIDPVNARLMYAGPILPQPAAGVAVADAELEEAWRALAAEDPAEAERAAARLAAAEDRALEFLRNEIKPAEPADAATVRQWIADLGHEEFARRDVATRELQRLGGEVEPALREALAAKPSPEAATRIETLLAGLAPDAQAGRKPDRDVLAVQVLARMGTPAAIDHLGELAAGIPGAPRTTEARKALQEFARDD